MNKTDFDKMGDRQKSFENREAGLRLMPGLPFLVRLDGRAFHTFTKGMARPYEARLSRAMIDTTKYLVSATHASIGYCQSDEITLAFPSREGASKMMFDGRLQKLSSVLAAEATGELRDIIRATMPEKSRSKPVFDARVWSVPSLEVAAEQFVWREADATRNSLTMAAHAFYSHKELHKVGFTQKHELLHAKGINWNDYPVFFKRGTYVRREMALRELTAAERAKVPANHQPAKFVMRSVLVEMEMPPITRVSNLIDTLFFDGEPSEYREPVAAAEEAGIR